MKKHSTTTKILHKDHTGLHKDSQTGLRKGQEIPAWIKSQIDDITPDEYYPDSDSEEAFANEHLEAESWLAEGDAEDLEWFFQTLNTKHEATARANMQPTDMLKLIKSFVPS